MGWLFEIGGMRVLNNPKIGIVAKSAQYCLSKLTDIASIVNNLKFFTSCPFEVQYDEVEGFYRGADCLVLLGFTALFCGLHK